MKKVFFAIIIISAFFIAAEFLARSYYFIKYKDASVYLYGVRSFFDVFRALKTDRLATDPYNHLKIERMADEVYSDRKNIEKKSIGARDPHKVIMFGYSDYINKHGFRGKEIEVEKSKGSIRVVALGGSFVQCVGVDDNQTWEVLLEDEIKKKNIAPYEIINAGSGAANISHLLVTLVEKLTALKPDYLILISAYNNHSLINSESRFSLQWRLSKTLYNVSKAYTILKNGISKILYKDACVYLYNYKVRVAQRDVENLLRRYNGRLEQIYNICRENDIKLILGMQPEYIPVHFKELQNLLDENRIAGLRRKLKKNGFLSYYELEFYIQGLLNFEMKKFAEKNAAYLFDGVSIFPHDKSLYFIDQIHLNEKGTKLFAEALYDFFKRNSILSDKR